MKTKITTSPPPPESLEEAEVVEHPLSIKSRFGWMPLVFMGIITLNLFLTLGLKNNVKLLLNQSDIYLQKVEGTVEVGQPVDKLHRSEAVIQTFVEDWLTLAYTWSSNDPKQFVRENSVNYPLALHSASLAIEPGYREAYLAVVSEKYRDRFPFQSYIGGKDKSYVRVFEAPIVEKVEEGVWDVTIIAYRTHELSEAGIVEEKFNHVIRVKAIKASNSRVVAEGATWRQKMLDQLQDRRLQIISINQF